MPWRVEDVVPLSCMEAAPGIIYSRCVEDRMQCRREASGCRGDIQRQVSCKIETPAYQCKTGLIFVHHVEQFPPKMQLVHVRGISVDNRKGKIVKFTLQDKKPALWVRYKIFKGRKPQ